MTRRNGFVGCRRIRLFRWGLELGLLFLLSWFPFGAVEREGRYRTALFTLVWVLHHCQCFSRMIVFVS